MKTRQILIAIIVILVVAAGLTDHLNKRNDNQSAVQKCNYILRKCEIV